MKIYAITYNFCNGEDYDMENDGEGVIDYYVTKELAMEAFDNIDPQDILDKYTAWMRCEDVEDYSLEKKINSCGLPDHYYEDKYEIGYFSYKIIEIDVIEKSTNERERLKDPK